MSESGVPSLASVSTSDDDTDQSIRPLVVVRPKKIRPDDPQVPVIPQKRKLTKQPRPQTIQRKRKPQIYIDDTLEAAPDLAANGTTREPQLRLWTSTGHYKCPPIAISTLIVAADAQEAKSSLETRLRLKNLSDHHLSPPKITEITRNNPRAYWLADDVKTTPIVPGHPVRYTTPSERKLPVYVMHKNGNVVPVGTSAVVVASDIGQAIDMFSALVRAVAPTLDPNDFESVEVNLHRQQTYLLAMGDSPQAAVTGGSAIDLMC